ncbi:phage minor capsid protein [Corynebacterium sp. A21]|uniref:phage minor capsid protein n=1 Tax=Corynebacterium sp. A21 TaxID=3457318 RepID=UPI003FD0DADD
MLDPYEAEFAADPVVALYRQAEMFLLGKIAESARRLSDAPNWMQAQLMEVQRLRRYAESAAGMVASRLPDLVAGSVENAHTMGVVQGLAEVEGLTATTAVTAASTIEHSAVVALSAQVSADLSKLDRGILRGTDDAWRKIIQNVTSRTVTGSQDVQSAWRAATKDMAAEGLTAFTDKAGRNWKLDTYAEMATRQATNEALMAGHTSVMVENGLDLIRVSSHANPAPMCVPYEGKILSISGAHSGTVVMPSGVGEGDAIVHVTASLDEAKANGLRHINCRHVWSAYVPGTGLPDIKHDPDNEGYKATQQQRYLERKVREWKRVEAAALDDAMARDARQRVRGYQARIRDVVAEHDLPRRRHREQLR